MTRSKRSSRWDSIDTPKRWSGPPWSALSCTGALQQAAEKVRLRRCFAIRKDGRCHPLLRSGADSRSSEILTYDSVRSGFLLPAALQPEFFEQSAAPFDISESCQKTYSVGCLNAPEFHGASPFRSGLDAPFGDFRHLDSRRWVARRRRAPGPQRTGCVGEDRTGDDNAADGRFWTGS